MLMKTQILNVELNTSLLFMLNLGVFLRCVFYKKILFRVYAANCYFCCNLFEEQVGFDCGYTLRYSRKVIDVKGTFVQFGTQVFPSFISLLLRIFWEILYFFFIDSTPMQQKNVLSWFIEIGDGNENRAAIVCQEPSYYPALFCKFNLSHSKRNFSSPGRVI